MEGQESGRLAGEDLQLSRRSVLRGIGFGAVAAGAGGLLAACGSGIKGAGSSASGTINIGFITPLTGNLAGADLESYTGRTITEPDRLREIVGEVARQGYAIVDQELEEGLRAIAAPIHGAGDAVIAAINVSAHASRVSLAAMRAELLPALLETAGRIEADLRSQGAN